MTTSAAVRATPTTTAPPRGVRWRRWRTDLLVYAGYLALALWVHRGLLADPTGRSSAASPNDTTQFQWMLLHGAKALTGAENPLFTHLLNTPVGVNLMANTSVLGLALPMAPVTLLFGPAVSFVVLGVLGLAGTAAGWYWVLSRHAVRSVPAAVVGGAFCGFAPAMISHAQSHLNWTCQWAVPFLVLLTLRLREPGSTVRRGVALGLLAAYQAFVNEEVLLYTGFGLTVFAAVYAAGRWSEVRPQVRRFAGGLGVAALVAGVLLAYPLWFQFAGPQAYRGLPDSVRDYSTDLAAYPAFPRQSIFGDPAVSGPLSAGPTEENAFFGWPLLLVAAGLAGWLWRVAVARAAAVVAVVAGVLALGPWLIVDGRTTGVVGPWRWLRNLPLLESVLPTRLSMVMIPAVGLLLALGTDRIRRRAARPVRLGWYAVLAAALVPLVPTSLPTREYAPTPRFITSGVWRSYVPAGRSLLTVPWTGVRDASGMRWAVRTDLALSLTGGYFLGPDTKGRGQFGTRLRYGGRLLVGAWRSPQPPQLSPADRALVRDELRYWRTSVVVLPLDHPRYARLRATVAAILGDPGRQVGDVWLWDIR